MPARRDITRAFFERLAERGHERSLEGVRGSVLFVIRPQRGRAAHWLVRVDDGAVEVAARAGEADCTVTTDAAEFGAVLRGRRNAMASVLREAITVEGDLSLLVRFQRLFGTSRRRAA